MISKVDKVCGCEAKGPSLIVKKTSIRALILYAIAVHVDHASFREGITVCADVSKAGSFETNLKTVKKSLPVRRHAVYVAGFPGIGVAVLE